MIVRANQYAEGSVVRAKPVNQYDTRWRIVGTVGLDAHARHAFYGGEVPDGSLTADIPIGWCVTAGPLYEPSPRAPCSDPREPWPWDGPLPDPHICPRVA